MMKLIVAICNFANAPKKRKETRTETGLNYLQRSLFQTCKFNRNRREVLLGLLVCYEERRHVCRSVSTSFLLSGCNNTAPAKQIFMRFLIQIVRISIEKTEDQELV